jgi:hypothetical protein
MGLALKEICFLHMEDPCLIILHRTSLATTTMVCWCEGLVNLALFPITISEEESNLTAMKAKGNDQSHRLLVQSKWCKTEKKETSLVASMVCVGLACFRRE